jgi:hypothetical protein
MYVCEEDSIIENEASELAPFFHHGFKKKHVRIPDMISPSYLRMAMV